MRADGQVHGQAGMWTGVRVCFMAGQKLDPASPIIFHELPIRGKHSFPPLLREFGKATCSLEVQQTAI